MTQASTDLASKHWHGWLRSWPLILRIAAVRELHVQRELLLEEKRLAVLAERREQESRHADAFAAIKQREIQLSRGLDELYAEREQQVKNYEAQNASLREAVQTFISRIETLTIEVERQKVALNQFGTTIGHSVAQAARAHGDVLQQLSALNARLFEREARARKSPSKKKRSRKR